MNIPTKLTGMKPIFACLLSLVLLIPDTSGAGDALTAFSRLNNAGLIVLDAHGQTVLAQHADMPLMPASTTKLATAWMALTHWGVEHRFRTHFYLDEATQILWVKGSGDPYLVSEELDVVARNLKQKGLKQIKSIGIDTSLFQPDLVLPGTGTTDNPYDAVPTAVSANFNTVAVRKVGGQVLSAEAHTPLTAYAESLAGSIRSGELRVNTGPNPHNAEKYFAELLAAFLQKNGVAVGSQIVFGQVPNLAVLYTHVNSKTLGEIVRSMLKYSTNFVANQLILMLSAENYKRPANATDVQRYMEETLTRRFGWKNFSLADGAGLSRHNRLSPQQLTELLQALRDWKHLLPEIEPGIYAKSGTLNGVSALAGYLVKRGEWQPFAVVMNENVPYHLRNRIARELSER
ncbi:MAG: D-alanyl-D-alanine carboxypeptidase [Methylococcaceae bacterium]|nr:D-alanyl-D-alanine carboxypeptidase [Methylococcaceae bacterium]